MFPWAVESSPFVFVASVTNLNESPRALAAFTIAWVRSSSSPLGHFKQKQRGLRVYYVAGPPLLNGRCTSLLRASRLRNDLYCVEWDVKLYYTIQLISWYVVDSLDGRCEIADHCNVLLAECVTWLCCVQSVEHGAGTEREGIGEGQNVISVADCSSSEHGHGNR